MEILATRNILAQLLLTRPRVDVYALKAISTALLGVPLPSSSNIPAAASPTTRLCLLPTNMNVPRALILRTLPAAALKLTLAPPPQPDSLPHRLVILTSRPIKRSHPVKIERVKRFPWRMLKRCFLRLPVYSLPSEWTIEAYVCDCLTHTVSLLFGPMTNSSCPLPRSSKSMALYTLRFVEIRRGCLLHSASTR